LLAATLDVHLASTPTGSSALALAFTLALALAGVLDQLICVRRRE
jgi:hypothetical protein